MQRNVAFKDLLLPTFLLINLLGIGITHSAPNSGTMLKQQENKQEETNIPRQLPKADKVIESNKVKSEKGVGPKVLIKDIKVDVPQNILSESDLSIILSDSIGKELGFDEINSLVTTLNEHLRSNGFILARAYLPQQDISGGIVNIKVLDGRLEGQDVDIVDINSTDLRISQDVLQKIASSRLTNDKAVLTSDVERVLLLINDLPAVSARATLKQGKTPGTTRINIDVKEDRMFSGVAWLDNYGSRYSGSKTINGQVNINDPLSIGDRFSGTVSLAERNKNINVRYSLPFLYDGIRINGTANFLDYEIGKELESSESEGNAVTYGFGASYPIIRSRRRNITVAGNYYNKELEDKVADVTFSNRLVDSFELRASMDNIDGWYGGGFSMISATLIFGDIDLSRIDSDLASDELTAKVNGKYTLLRCSASRLQRLPGQFSLWGSFKAQMTNQNLDSSEKFSLGGINGIRAYPGGEANGDQGWQLTTEVRYDLKKGWDFGNVQLFGFLDLGGIRLNRNPWENSVTTITEKNQYNLTGIGFGASLLKSGEYNVKAQIAAPLVDNDGRDTNGNDSDGLTEDVRFWLGASYQF